MVQVVFCTDGIFPYAIGGMQRHSRLLIESLAAIPDLEIIVVHPHTGIRVFADNQAIQEIAVPGVTGKSYYLRELYDYSRKVREIAERFPNAVVFSQGLSVWNGLKCEHGQLSPLGRRTVMNPHGLEPWQAPWGMEKLKSVPIRMAFEYIFPRVSRVVSTGGGHLARILNKILQNSPGKVVVLPNATNPPPLTDINLHKDYNPPRRFLFVGRFAENKGIPYLLEAMYMLNKEGYSGQYEVVMAGKGPLLDKLKRKYPMPESQFLGFVPDENLNLLYRDLDFFILPTLFEGMPTVVLEAMSYGMPIIVTDVGATRDMVDDSNGTIIPKHSASAIASSMKQYIQMPREVLQQKAFSSRNRVSSHFTWDIVAKGYADIFRSLHAAIRIQDSSFQR